MCNMCKLAVGDSIKVGSGVLEEERKWRVRGFIWGASRQVGGKLRL